MGRIKGEAAKRLRTLRSRQVRGPADVQAVRHDVQFLGRAFPAAEIITALGPDAARLGIAADDAGRLVVRDAVQQAQTEVNMHHAAFDLLATAKQAGRRIVAKALGLRVDQRYAGFCLDGAAVKRQHYTSQLQSTWSKADMLGRAHLMWRVPAIRYGGLATAEHHGDFDSMNSYKVKQRTHDIVASWGKLQAERQPTRTWRFDEHLPSAMYTSELLGYDEAYNPQMLFHTSETMARALEPITLRAGNRTLAACRSARLVCERTFVVVDPDLNGMLADGEGVDLAAGAIMGDEDFLLPVATVLAGAQDVGLSEYLPER